MTTYPVANMNVTLPPIRSLFSSTSLPSPSPSLDTDEGLASFAPITKGQHDCYLPPLPPFPVSVPSHANHTRRVSASSVDSLASSPSLVYSSPSPSPPPSIVLVPCEMQRADAVIIVPSPSTPMTPSSLPSQSTSPVLRLCKPSEAKATLFIGPAISMQARKRAAGGDCRMHPYRLVRERRGSQGEVRPAIMHT